MVRVCARARAHVHVFVHCHVNAQHKRFRRFSILAVLKMNGHQSKCFIVIYVHDNNNSCVFCFILMSMCIFVYVGGCYEVRSEGDEERIQESGYFKD